MPPEPLSDQVAQRVADTMFALSTPSRLRILGVLRDGPLTVSEIVEVVGLEQSAVSHQLRVLRDNSVLSVTRIGRRRQYALNDQHVRSLLDEALAHVLALDGRSAPAAPGAAAVSGESVA